MNGFFQTPVVYSGNDLPVILESDIERYAVAFEADAYEHWALNGADPSLIGLVNSRVLTKVGTITSASGIFSMQANTSAKNGLKSGKIDSRVQTQCAIIRVDSLPTASSSGSILMGTLSSSAGSAVFIDENPFIRRQFRPTITVAGEKSAAGLANKWLFVAFSEDGTATSMKSTVLVGGTTPSVVVKEYAQAKTVSTLGVGVGPIDYSSGAISAAVKLDVLEYIVYDKVLSDAELLAVYSRSKTRLANRGFVVE